MVLFLKVLLNRSRLSNIPAVGMSKGREQRRKEFMSGKARSLYVEGYKKVRRTNNSRHYQKLTLSQFKDSPFRIMTARGMSLSQTDLDTQH